MTTNVTVSATPGVIRAMNHFSKLTDKAYQGTASRYIKNGPQEIKEFWDFVANGFARYLETGDIRTLNQQVEVALAKSRFRSWLRVCKPLSCHKFDAKAKKFVGKIDKAAKARLIETHADSGLENWEFRMKEYIGKEEEHSEKAPAKDWSAEAAVLQLLKQAKKNDVPIPELTEVFVKAVKETATQAA